MDIISFNEASTANSRIENFNANPDSTSGIVTQPSIIQSGEIVSIPAGRTAIMANTVIDGTINLDGTMFIPSGSSVDFTNGITVNGNSISLSIPTSYHLLQGNLSVSNEVITNGFSTTLYTRNDTTQSVVTGIDMSTQWGNYVSETFGGLVWYKDRLTAGAGHVLYDTVRGINKYVQTNTISAEGMLTDGLLSFNNDGFNVGTNAILNSSTVSWNFQTTHRRTGVTNHGKAYTEHYNPFTGFTIIKYEGSGLAGHEIPHSLGRKLGFVTFKNLNGTSNWQVHYNSTNRLELSTTGAQTTGYLININNTNCTLLSDSGTHVAWNGSTNQHIMYGWANSYYDTDNTLIGNYEIGIYQGNGVAGNKVKTRGKPAWIMIKRLDDIGTWTIFDNIRNSFDGYVKANNADVELTADILDSVSDGFILKIVDAYTSASGSQYLYMVVYDNDSGSGKSKYPKATDTSNVQINNAIIPLAHGVDSNGSKNSIIVANETITGLTYTQGKNYLYKTDTGYGVKPYEPRYLSSELVRRFAGESPDYYDGSKNKWYNCDAGNELVSDGTFSSGLGAFIGLSFNGTNIVSDSSILTNVSASAVLTVLSGKIYPTIERVINTEIGKEYTIKIALGTTTSSVNEYRLATSTSVNTTSLDTNRFKSGILSTGLNIIKFIATTTTTALRITCNSTTINQFTVIDNISVFEADIVPTTEITESRNYLNHIVNADQNGQVTYVEELPKIEYKDIIKANEYQGKNACTAWVNFDGTTIPPTIRDSYNVSAVINIGIGLYDIYFKEEMDNTSYSACMATQVYSNTLNVTDNTYKFNRNKLQVSHTENNVSTNTDKISVQIFGGKN